MARPERVRMRERNPCLRLRRRTFGWYVRFIEKRFLGKSRFEQQGYGPPETLSKLREAVTAFAGLHREK